MSVTLNNITTAAAYSEESEVTANYPLRSASIRVYNAAVYRELLVGLSDDPRTAVWQSELFVAPGGERVRRRHLFGVRVRSAVAAASAQVTIELVGRHE